MRRANKGGRGSHEDYAALPKYDRQPVEEHGSIEAALGRGSGPACMWLLALQIVMLFGQAFLLRGNVHVKSQEMVQWYEPSQISRDAHESLVVAVVVREGSDGQPEIWTRRRPAHVDGRNKMYAGRWEALAKPLRHGESPIAAIQMPFRDIFGMNDNSDFSNVRIMGTLNEDVNVVLTTVPDDFACMDANLSRAELQNCERENMRKQDRYFVLHNPYLYVQALRGTTPWTAVGMVTVLQDHAKYNPSVAGLEMRWWKVDELTQALTKTPSLFTGVHFPVLLKAASDLQAGRIKLSHAPQYRALTYSGNRQDGYFSDVVQNGTRIFEA